MRAHAWNYWLTAAFLLGGVATAAFNFFADPYEIFGHQYLRNGYAINERYRKVEHLLSSKAGHDSFILGSSVMGVFDPSEARRLTGRSWYNLSFLAGTPQESLDTLQALHRAGKPIREVLIGVDFFTFYEYPQGGDQARRPHPFVSGESWPSFYGSYLFTSSLWQGYSRIAHHFQPQPSIFFDVEGTGMYHLFEYDRLIATDYQEHLRQHFPANSFAGVNVRWIDQRFVEFANLCEWLDDNHVQARIFIHPFYQSVRASISDASFDEFRRRLVQIRPDIVDFSESRDVTQDDHWYYDKKHYRPVVADMVMAAMLNGPPM